MGKLKFVLKNVLENRGWFVRRLNGLPNGVDICLDLKRFTNKSFQVIFDVGAHHGETSLVFTQHFPEAKIYAFEPVSENFSALSARVRRLPNVACFRTALGDRKTDIEIFLQPDSQTHSLNRSVRSGEGSGAPTEIVAVTTIDEFVQSEHINKICLLKIDSEGYEIPILKGSDSVLKERRIEMIFLEASLSPGDNDHSALVSVQEFLLRYRYNLVALYDQAVWCNPLRLGYFNALFAQR